MGFLPFFPLLPGTLLSFVTGSIHMKNDPVPACASPC
jgi:hypothetical protein